MSDSVTITAEPRAVVGKQVKTLRREGLVPGVIYGPNQPVNVQMAAKPLRRALQTAGTSQLVDLAVSDNTYKVLVREIQQHPTRGDVLHVDFLEVDMKSELTVEADLVLVGKARPEVAGLGSVIQILQSVSISCLPNDLVGEIEVDAELITSIHGLIHVSDIKAPAGITILEDLETVVARFEALHDAEEERDDTYAMSADSVEVIGRSADKDENF